MANLLIWLLVLCIVIGVAFWIINSFLPEPIRKWAIAVLVVLCAIFVIQFLVGGGMHSISFQKW